MRLLPIALLLVLGLGCPQPRVLVVGLDGADWDVVDPLVAAGYLPTLGAIVAEGARAGLDCVPAWPERPCYCPPVWTTYVTGWPRAVHGISEVEDPSWQRRVPALWEVNRAIGGTSALVSVRGTWPPEDSAEWVMTEPGLDHAASLLHAAWWPSTHPGVARPETHTRPAGLFEALGLLPYEGERRPAWLMFARDRVAMEALLRLALTHVVRERSKGERRRSELPTLTFVTLHSPDRAQHMTWARIQATPAHPIDEAALLAVAARWSGPVFDPAPWGWGTVASQYLEADAWLGTLLAHVPYDYVVLLSDHGMARNPDPAGVPGRHDALAPDAHVGILVLRGPGIRPGASLGVVSALDVAPTLAYLLGAPVAADLPGRVLREAFEARHLAERPVLEVAHW